MTREALAGWAIERLARDHAADPKVEEVLGRTQYLGWIVDHKVLLALYDRVIAANKDKEAQSTATTLKALLIHEGPPGVEPGEKERKGSAPHAPWSCCARSSRSMPALPARRRPRGTYSSWRTSRSA